LIFGVPVASDVPHQELDGRAESVATETSLEPLFDDIEKSYSTLSSTMQIGDIVEELGQSHRSISSSVPDKAR
jgi:hypothetical protein